MRSELQLGIPPIAYALRRFGEMDQDDLGGRQNPREQVW